MSEEPSRRFFIPPWLDDLDLKPHPFRVLCHLLRRAGEDGLCYTSAPSIAAKCHINKDTIWTALKSLEKAAIITRQPKKFGRCNRYLITPPIGGNKGVNGDGPISGKPGPIDFTQSAEKAGRQSAEKAGCQSAEKAGCKEIPLKKTNIKKSNRENSPEGIQFAQWFRSSLPESVNLKPNWQQSFAEIHDKLVRIDNRTPEQIWEVSRWARTDKFWKTNFMSPSKLRDRNPGGIQYFDIFAEKLKQPAGQPSKPQATMPNTGGRTSTNSEDV